MGRFRFGKRSERNLAGVDERLVQVARTALELSHLDFAVVDGLRTLAEQEKLVAQGRSQTMESRHLTGHAIDVVPWIGGAPRWEAPLFPEIAVAFGAAAERHGTPLRWGGAWNVGDVRGVGPPSYLAKAAADYIALRHAEGRRPFFDGPHFEIPLG